MACGLKSRSLQRTAASATAANSVSACTPAVANAHTVLASSCGLKSRSLQPTATSITAVNTRIASGCSTLCKWPLAMPWTMFAHCRAPLEGTSSSVRCSNRRSLASWRSSDTSHCLPSLFHALAA
eukprot:7292699-Prymnesium_polylepis.1